MIYIIYFQRVFLRDRLMAGRAASGSDLVYVDLKLQFLD